MLVKKQQSSVSAWFTGSIVAVVTGIVSNDPEAASTTFTAVTCCIAALGMAIFGAGTVAGMYAVHGDTAFEEDNASEPDEPTSYVYR